MNSMITSKGSYAATPAAAASKRAQEKAMRRLGYGVAKALCPGETLNCISAKFSRETNEYEFLVTSLPEIPTQKSVEHLFTGDANAILNVLYNIRQAG